MDFVVDTFHARRQKDCLLLSIRRFFELNESSKANTESARLERAAKFLLQSRLTKERISSHFPAFQTLPDRERKGYRQFSESEKGAN
jgi:hypothetical protein